MSDEGESGCGGGSEAWILQGVSQLVGQRGVGHRAVLKPPLHQRDWVGAVAGLGAGIAGMQPGRLDRPRWHGSGRRRNGAGVAFLRSQFPL